MSGARLETFRTASFVITSIQNNRKHERFGHFLLAIEY